jgi:hypothetical protein
MTKSMFAILKLYSCEPPQINTKLLLPLYQIIIFKKKNDLSLKKYLRIQIKKDKERIKKIFK